MQQKELRSMYRNVVVSIYIALLILRERLQLQWLLIVAREILFSPGKIKKMYKVNIQIRHFDGVKDP